MLHGIFITSLFSFDQIGSFRDDKPDRRQTISEIGHVSDACAVTTGVGNFNVPRVIRGGQNKSTPHKNLSETREVEEDDNSLPKEPSADQGGSQSPQPERPPVTTPPRSSRPLSIFHSLHQVRAEESLAKQQQLQQQGSPESLNSNTPRRPASVAWTSSPPPKELKSMDPLSRGLQPYPSLGLAVAVSPMQNRGAVPSSVSPAHRLAGAQTLRASYDHGRPLSARRPVSALSFSDDSPILSASSSTAVFAGSPHSRSFVRQQLQEDAFLERVASFSSTLALSSRSSISQQLGASALDKRRSIRGGGGTKGGLPVSAVAATVSRLGTENTEASSDPRNSVLHTAHILETRSAAAT